MTLARTSLPATGAPSTSSTAGLVFSCSMACLRRVSFSSPRKSVSGACTLHLGHAARVYLQWYSMSAFIMQISSLQCSARRLYSI